MAKPGPEMEAGERVKVIGSIASDFSVNPDSKASHYVRSGKEMLRCASNYVEDGNPENAYILYMRFLTMFLDKLRHHPGFKELPPGDKKQMNSLCNGVLPKTESLKKELLAKYEKEHLEYKKRLDDRIRRAQEEKQREEQRRADEERQNALVADALARVGAGAAAAGNPRLSNTGGNANANANADATKTKPLPAWVSPEWQYEFPWNPLDTSQQPRPSAPSSALANVSYSNILDKQDMKVFPNVSQPEFDRNTKPNRFLSPMSSGLRQVVIPGDLISEFLKCAEKNTRSNCETCGFLTGKIKGGKLVITDLIIPKQEGGPDSCTTRGEEEYFQIQDQYELITFGWIHTHPTQTAFLSSVDMHSQYSYQQMMPEAIAIVCAPGKEQVGTFTLNPREGMEVIGNCKETGFHQHPFSSVPLFIDATHHIFDTSLKVEVRDIR